MTTDANTCRAYLANQIRLDHPAWAVEASPAEPDQVRRGKVYVALWREAINPGKNSLELTHPMKLQLYGAKDNGEPAEEELDATLDQLLLSLERLPRFEFKAADRMLLKNVFQGWEITGSILTENIYRNALSQERETQ